MWIVEYKPNSDSQSWVLLKSYDNKESAVLHASKVYEEYYMVKVTDPDGSVIWSN